MTHAWTNLKCAAHQEPPFVNTPENAKNTAVTKSMDSPGANTPNNVRLTAAHKTRNGVMEACTVSMYLSHAVRKD